MKANVSILIPFDLGLELDFVGQDAKEIVKEVLTRQAGTLTFDGKSFPDVQLSGRLYKFGIGLIQLSFAADGDMEFFADFFCRVETSFLGKILITAWARTLVDGLLVRAKKFASHQYERRLTDVDLFPVLILGKGVVVDAGQFIQKNQKALYGIVAGEAHHESLSNFVLEQEKLVNFGYYEKDLILIKRFGAVVASEESKIILDLIRLAYATYWNLRAYNFLMDEEVDQAKALLSHLPPYYKFWAMPRRYQRFSTEAMAFGMDKLAIVDTLYNVSANIPHIDSDWHLRTIYKNVEKEFDIDDLSKAVDLKLERIESTYSSARDFLSTNFFIAVEIVLFLSFAWMILDTSLLYVIAHK